MTTTPPNTPSVVTGPPTRPGHDVPSGAVPRERGVLYGFAAYGIWGLFPLYFAALTPAGPMEILVHRILWTFVLCVAIILVRRDLRWIMPVLRRPVLLAGITAAALLIAVNWFIYVTAVVNEHVTEASLGYFLNPIVTVALGVVVLRERLRPLQWVAVGIGTIAAVYLSIDEGSVPVIALSLAFSFGLYGLTKNRLGASLAAVHGLVLETAVLTPVAALALVLLAAHGDSTYVGHGAWHTALLSAAGVATAVPLLLFAAAARRIPLVTIGLLQFLTPVMQLLCGVLLLGETMTAARWFGFGIVWVALMVLTIDSVRVARRRPAVLA